MQRDLALTGLSAAASAALYLSLATGVLGAPLFAYFVQLPLLFVGFSIGLGSAALAGIGSLGLILVFGGGIAALVFLVVQLGPSLLAVRQSLLNRPAADGSTEWYPPGHVLGSLVVYAAVVMILALLWVRLATGDVSGTFAQAIGELADQLGGTQAAAVAQAVTDYASIVPGIVAVSWVLMTVINAALAQFLALRSGRTQRPAFALAQLTLPAWCGPALGITAAASLVAGGDVAFFVQGLAALFAVPYLLQGLAVVHCLADRLPARGLALAGFYLMLLLFSWPLLIGIVALGLVEDWAQLRRRLT